ncbi:hypothetical protein M1O57_06010 [Dehalococcoidia bacterium]|nr:hypothetical protein [Dehalococcoidia bacterium]MCL0105120.1 hypothetical protein [Dehalococcoidia bacterium]
MQAIRGIVATEKLKQIINIPENFGDKVEVIVLPVLERNQKNIIEFEDVNGNSKKIAGWSDIDWQELVEENLMRDSTTTKDLF